MHLIADAGDVEDDVILAVAIDDALELADHDARFHLHLQHDAGAVMRVGDRDGERVGGVLGLRLGLRQQHADHHAHLRLLAVAGADNALLHDVGGVFGNAQARPGRHQHGDSACLAKGKRRRRVGIDEGLLHRRLVWTIRLDHREQAVMDCHQPLAERGLVGGRNRAAGDIDQPVAVGLDQAPAGAPEPRIDAENANRLGHHGPVDSPAARPRLGPISHSAQSPVASGPAT